MERKHIIVAYGDITGYTPWSRSALNATEVRDSFMAKFEEELAWFVLSSDFKVKYIGDGFMVLRELKERGHRMYDALRFLFGIHKLTLRIQELIEQSEFPRPKGFRVRFVAGIVTKNMMPDPNNKEKKVEEYWGSVIDLSQKLLKVAPSVTFICHGSVVDLIGKRFDKLVFKKLRRLKILSKSFDPEDVKDLWTFEFKNGFHIA